jgi:hypothetical protein
MVIKGNEAASILIQSKLDSTLILLNSQQRIVFMLVLMKYQIYIELVPSLLVQSASSNAF